ncbi:metallophosphoesterase [Planctopirus limnophila DSM 3776]|uniref:Metallophosphoesterase n=1 Tax=Planctopirus limnophila (strain ATCC 43296 / DSM 3776 / IFAM 1008 / Mu 290) TaxID=521674 RepID=D5SSN6_PLAL2|nr:DNA repair exonuclease [Planctopirus limnophila]ADG68837.1 metallophosphoesterase [Planctopirus limnophila DSM 3776]
MPSFLHVADLHLDSPRSGLSRDASAPVSEIQQAPRRALERLIDEALRRKVSAVVIAGDLYDGDWKDHQTGLFFVRQAQKLADARIPVVMITGNHDAQSVITQQLPLPPNVKVLSVDAPETFLLEDCGLALHGQGFKNRAVPQNLSANYPAKINSLLNIGLLHTSLTGFEGHEVYAPCSLSDLARTGYEYWALGHIHKRQEFPLASGGMAVFPGNLQGRHIRECGPKGCEIIEYQPNGILQRESIVLDVFRWELLSISVDGLSSRDEILALIEDHLRAFRTSADPQPHALRIELMGATTCHGQLIDRQRELRAEIQSLVVQSGSGNWWLEDLSLRTTFPEASIDAALTSAASQELLALARSELQAAHSSPELHRLMQNLTEDLRKKLPAEISWSDVLGPTSSHAAGSTTNQASTNAGIEWSPLLEESLALLSARLEQPQTQVSTGRKGRS